jgi:HPt (histidine-containing phosphotransfer) domain-containing protein
MLQRGLSGARESCERLKASNGDIGQVAQEAHRLRGTAGTFGLMRISALAGAVEARLANGADTEDLVLALAQALEDSRLAIGAYLARHAAAGDPAAR